MNGIKKAFIAAGAIGTAAGLAYLNMKPSQQKKIERSLKKTSDQLYGIASNIHEKMS